MVLWAVRAERIYITVRSQAWFWGTRLFIWGGGGGAAWGGATEDDNSTIHGRHMLALYTVGWQTTRLWWAWPGLYIGHGGLQPGCQVSGQDVPTGGNRSSQLGINKQTNACWSLPKSQTVFIHFKTCIRYAENGNCEAFVVVHCCNFQVIFANCEWLTCKIGLVYGNLGQLTW